MAEFKNEDSFKWSLIVGFTIILAGITGFIVVNRQEFFPETYKRENKHPASEHPAEIDTTTKESESSH
jgi:hypothetical protein